jgi:xanthine/uracil permease
VRRLAIIAGFVEYWVCENVQVDEVAQAPWFEIQNMESQVKKTEHIFKNLTDAETRL